MLRRRIRIVISSIVQLKEDMIKEHLAYLMDMVKKEIK